MSDISRNEFAYEPVLFVDDNEFIRSKAAMVLETMGIDYLLAANGDEAMRLLEKDRFSLVITDIVMPKMDGIELISWMRSARIDVPVIVLSGKVLNESLSYSELATKFGADIGFHKPLTPTKIEMAMMFRAAPIDGPAHIACS